MLLQLFCTKYRFVQALILNSEKRQIISNQSHNLCLHRLLEFGKGDDTVSVGVYFSHDGFELLIGQILTELGENLVKLGLGSGTC